MRNYRSHRCAVRSAALRASVALVVWLGATGIVAAQATTASPHCRSIGGTVTTNFIDQTTTLGTATGDLAGAVSAVLLNVTFQDEQTGVFTVQHHWVTETGDTVRVAVAHAVARQTAPNLFGIVSYPVTITGGTGAFEGASGMVTNIGAVDLNTGRTVFRVQRAAVPPCAHSVNRRWPPCVGRGVALGLLLTFRRTRPILRPTNR